MYGDEAIDICGQNLRSYFTSIEEICSNPEIVILASALLCFAQANRLCILRIGLLGVVPTSMQLNDKIVVLSGYDIPIILRPRGETYEVIGSCSVAGLMKGKVADGIR